MRINKSSDSGNQEEKNAVTAVGYGVLVFWGRFWVFGLSKLHVLKQMKKPLFFFWCVKGNDAGMQLLLLSLKSQQSSINKF